jgi:hypothetical protein
MNLKMLVVGLLLIAALACAVVGGAMYFQGPKGTLAALIGILMMSVGAGSFGLLAIAFFRGWPPKSRIRNAHRDTPFNRWRYVLGMLVGVVFGALSLWFAFGAVFAGEFPAGRRPGSLPVRFSDSPGGFVLAFLAFSGIGFGLLWLCLPPVLRAIFRGDGPSRGPR